MCETFAVRGKLKCEGAEEKKNGGWVELGFKI
jgi:hypothetical protein